MPKRELKHPDLPDAHGFSRAVEAPAGRTIYVAGQVPTRADGLVVGKGNLRLQTVAVMDKLKAILEANGSRMDDFVSLTIYVTDMGQMGVVRDVRMGYFTPPYPAMTGVEVTALADPDFMIETDGVAVLES